MDAGGMDGVVRRLFVPDMDAGGMDAATDSAAAPAHPADAESLDSALAALRASPLSTREQIAWLANDPLVLNQLASLRAFDPSVDSWFKGFMGLALSCREAPRSPKEVFGEQPFLIVGDDGAESSQADYPYGPVGTTADGSFPAMKKALGDAFGGEAGQSEAHAHALLQACVYANVFRREPFEGSEGKPALTQLQRAQDIGCLLSLVADLAAGGKGPLRLLGFGDGIKLLNLQLAGLGRLGPTLPEGVGGNPNPDPNPNPNAGSNEHCSAVVRRVMGVLFKWSFVSADGAQIGQVHVGEFPSLAHLIDEGCGWPVTTLHLARLLREMTSPSTAWDPVPSFEVVLPAAFDPKALRAKEAWLKAGALSPWDPDQHVSYFEIDQGAAGAPCLPLASDEEEQ